MQLKELKKLFQMSIGSGGFALGVSSPESQIRYKRYDWRGPISVSSNLASKPHLRFFTEFLSQYEEKSQYPIVYKER